VQLVHVAKEEDEDAHALEASEECEEAEPEHGNGRKPSRRGYVGDMQEAEVIVGVGISAGGEHGEDDDEAATGDDDCAQEDGE
jgi:hypothetical protein